MSIGIGGFCKKFLEDDIEVIYAYCGYNLNEADYENEERIFDGYITIEKEYLVEPEIHKKLKRMPSGKKRLIIKKIPNDVCIIDLISNGNIKIENCSSTWKTTPEGYDVVALRLLYELFHDYQLAGKLPEQFRYDV